MRGEKEEEVIDLAKTLVRKMKENSCDILLIDVDGVQYQVEAIPVEFVKRGVLLK
jgi:hypothetical protein